MKRLVLPLSALMVVACGTHEKPEPTVRFPGEFEPQEAIWLAWEGDSAYDAVSVSMIRSLLPHVQVKMAVDNDSLLRVCRHHLDSLHIDTSAIAFHVVPGAEFWMRDGGATYVVKDSTLNAVDFGWNTYALHDWLLALFEGDTLRADTVAAMDPSAQRGITDSLCATAEGIPMMKSWFRIEGGALESNGRGTLILNEPLTLQRNHDVSKDSIAHELEHVLGATNIIWLPHGLAEDPHMWGTIAPGYFGMGAGGHTDEYVRFADAHTIMLAWVPENEQDADPVSRLNHDRMSANYAVLAKAMDQDGEPFRILKVPVPDPRTRTTIMLEPKQWDDSFNVPASAFRKKDGWAAGDTALRVAAASYMNFLVTNDAVLLPTYVAAGSSRAKEEEVKRLFTEAFPGRELIMLDAMALNWHGGGIHCGTQQLPKHAR